jgi:hypothetical protein
VIPGVLLALTIAANGQSPQAVAVPVPAVPASPAEAAALARRRDQITVMEGVLAAAVGNGARQALRQIQGTTPGPVLFSSQPNARGFLLDGYGVFFNLEIPTLRPSAVWSMQTMERDQAVAANALDALRTLADSVTDPDAKKNYLAAVHRLEQQMGLPPQARRTGAINAVAETVKAPEQNPEEVYTTSVINASLEAMIEHSKPMELKAEEWFTIALSAVEGPLAPGQISERETIVVRMKGADLADYLAGRISRDEVRKKVDVRMF